MLIFKVPSRTWTAFARILRLSGTGGLQGVQREVVPTWEQSRTLQSDRVKSILYEFTLAAVADTESTLQWRDASDWTSVSVNGVVTTNDDQLPAEEDTLIITAIALGVSTTPAEYDSAEVVRILPVAGFFTLAQFGALIANHDTAMPVSPSLLPQILTPLEVSVRFRSFLTFVAGVQFAYKIQIISAEPGVLAVFPGV